MDAIALDIVIDHLSLHVMTSMESLDELFAQIASNSGGIAPLLDNFFGFLHRKTDFYVVYGDMNGKASMGFKAGQAEALLLDSFNKYSYRDYETLNEQFDEKNTNNRSTESSQSDKSNQITQKKKASSAVEVSTDGRQIPVGNGGTGFDIKKCLQEH